MDSRNVFVAIALSLAVLLFWSAFFETPRPIETGNIVQKEKSDSDKALEGDAITPNINQLELQTAIPREESIKKTQRIQIENNKITK